MNLADSDWIQTGAQTNEPNKQQVKRQYNSDILNLDKKCMILKSFNKIKPHSLN